MTYKAIKTDIAKLKARIAQRQRRCDQAASKQDLEMARMYENDVKDLTDILNFVNDRDFKIAWRVICRVDTAVRDEIPVRLYNFIAKENGYC